MIIIHMSSPTDNKEISPVVSTVDVPLERKNPTALCESRGHNNFLVQALKNPHHFCFLWQILSSYVHVKHDTVHTILLLGRENKPFVTDGSRAA